MILLTNLNVKMDINDLMRNLELEESSSDELLEKIIKDEKQNQDNTDKKWKDSRYMLVNDLKANNSGRTGELFIEEICKKHQLPYKKSKKGSLEGVYDIKINNKRVEQKTARLGFHNNFQHELGYRPWDCDYFLFLDVCPNYFYITVVKSLEKQSFIDQKENKAKWGPCFPTKRCCSRNGKKGAYKFDFTEKHLKFVKDIGNTLFCKNINTIEIANFIMKLVR